MSDYDWPIGLIYATNSGSLRRVINSPDGYADTLVGAGETLLIVEKVDLDHPVVPMQYMAEAMVAQELGKMPEDSRCAVIDPMTGNVVGAIMADPTIDSLLGYELVRHAEAGLGWTRVGNELVPPIDEPVLP